MRSGRYYLAFWLPAAVAGVAGTWPFLQLLWEGLTSSKEGMNALIVLAVAVAVLPYLPLVVLLVIALALRPNKKAVTGPSIVAGLVSTLCFVVLPWFIVHQHRYASYPIVLHFEGGNAGTPKTIEVTKTVDAITPGQTHRSRETIEVNSSELTLIKSKSERLDLLISQPGFCFTHVTVPPWYPLSRENALHRVDITWQIKRAEATWRVDAATASFLWRPDTIIRVPMLPDKVPVRSPLPQFTEADNAKLMAEIAGPNRQPK